MYHTFKTLLVCMFVGILFAGCNGDRTEVEYVSFVNPLIGTAPATTPSALKHGHGTENYSQVVPYVTTPFGMTNWTPQTRDTESKCVAPYYYTDQYIQGFRGSHWLSGSCVQDYGSMTIMPLTGELKVLPEERASVFSHEQEISTPYYYKAHLEDYDIDVEMTATRRAGIFRFSFGKEGLAHVVLNTNSDEGEGYVRILPGRNEIEGYNPVHRIYQGWGDPAGFSGYFVARFDRPLETYGVFVDSTILEGGAETSTGMNTGAYISFVLEQGEQIGVLIGTSFTSREGARANLDSEAGSQGFEFLKQNLKAQWEGLLGKVRVEGGSQEDYTKFYTALYHSLLHPRTFNDVDGSYPSFSGGDSVLQACDHDYYTDFSMWDTYRASHPLFNLLVPSESESMIRSLLLKAEQGGWLPIFPCWNSYTSAMIGDHVIATVADACVKGIVDLDDQEYALLLQNAFESPGDFADYRDGKGRRALASYLEHGYVPLEDGVTESFHQKEQVSRTLEYAFDDFALAQVADLRGDTANYRHLRQRALNYQNVYSSADSAMVGRSLAEGFLEGVDIYTKQPFITEGTPFQYTWYVPHDVAGLAGLMGGEEHFNRVLDRFFISGQYWHGNEPGHQIPFLSNYSGQPWKTQERVGEVMRTEYGTGPGGLSGNDDAGQMSAWYVFAALGFYPVCPSVPEYVLSGPRFDRISLSLGNEKELLIYAPGVSEGKHYIRELRFNGKVYDKNYLLHQDLLQGGRLDFVMDTEPGSGWGVEAGTRPYSMSSW